MKAQILKPGVSVVVGLLLTAPTLYFILVSVLKYVFELPALFDATVPALEALGIKDAIGWNINLLLLFGPLLALLFNLTAVSSLNWKANGHEVNIHLTFQKQCWNWVVIGLSSVCLVTLFVYAMGENCNC